MTDDKTLVPVYEMSWEDGSSRRTDDRVPQKPALVELLKEQAENDPQCEEVTLVGMAN